MGIKEKKSSMSKNALTPITEQVIFRYDKIMET